MTTLNIACAIVIYENRFPMIPSGKAHNDMLLGEASTFDAIRVGRGVLV